MLCNSFGNRFKTLASSSHAVSTANIGSGSTGGASSCVKNCLAMESATCELRLQSDTTCGAVVLTSTPVWVLRLVKQWAGWIVETGNITDDIGVPHHSLIRMFLARFERPSVAALNWRQDVKIIQNETTSVSLLHLPARRSDSTVASRFPVFSVQNMLKPNSSSCDEILRQKELRIHQRITCHGRVEHNRRALSLHACRTQTQTAVKHGGCQKRRLSQPPPSIKIGITSSSLPPSPQTSTSTFCDKSVKFLCV